ncbi:MAG: hypothetical protein OSJ74_07255 [Clostridia bacterium]|nr:hypothetical protein [Clostridia bacterium]
MNIKKIQSTVADLSDSLERHVASAISSYYFVMPLTDGAGKISLRVYSQGGEAEIEAIALSQGGEAQCDVTVDGKNAGRQLGLITIRPLSLERGWRNVEIALSGGITAGRIRLSGAIRSAKVSQ